jgi:alpha-beta hydrolase superfamily lysophospholipase
MPAVIGRATTADGVGLRTRHWPAADPWAAILIVHGLGEHSGRYEHVGEQFSAAGIDAHAFDLRGMGGSDGPRGDIERWASIHDDVAERLSAVRERAAGGPIVLYGHSLGGLIVTGYLLTDHRHPDLAVVTAPGLDSTLPRWKLRLAPLLARVVPTLALSIGIAGDVRSRDPEVDARVRADPLCGTTSTTRFAAAATAEQARVRAGVGSIATPMLVLHGLDDGLVPPSASEAFEGVPGVERRTYPGLRHELHNEPEGPQILAEVIAWIRDHARLREQPNTASGERHER